MMLYYVQIVWENQHRGDEGNDCMTSADCTDCPYQATGKYWFSFKFKDSGLCYLIVISIKHGDIVWIDGPFPCGVYNDIKIFRWAFKEYLDEHEWVEADDGFIREAPEHVKCPKSFVRDELKLALQSHVQSRHETVNKCMKQFGCLKHKFRHHDFDKHAACFRAVAVLTQLAIEFGEPLFEVDYSDL